MSDPTPSPLIVWRFADGLRGHENQSDGLIEALARQAHLSTHIIDVPRSGRFLAAWRLLDGERTRELPDPHLLIGAGEATHLAILAARRARGGRAVVLMKPTLPGGWFDLVIVPSHDRVSLADNVLVTRGALNRMRPGAEKRAGEGLVLLGGPDANYAWREDRLARQIETIAGRERDVGWSVSSSRRTPGAFLDRVHALGLANVRTVAVDDVDAAWLPGVLATASRVWVTEDSVSMIYEALTAGAAIGVLPMARRRLAGIRRAGWMKQGLDSLVKDHMVTPFSAWENGQPLQPTPEPLDEAGRCARWILDAWFPSTDRL
jgi:mitochondrial fission protein ELM1